MKHFRSKVVFPGLFFLSALLAPFPLSPSDLSDIDSLAPVEVVVQGFKEPTGVVVDQNGVVFVSDREGGEVSQIDAGALHPVITHLDRPVGLAFDGEGRLLIVEEKDGVLLRLETSGVLTVLAQGMEKPRWVTVAENGYVYISAKGLKSQGDKEEDDEDEEQGEVVLRLTPDLALTVFATGFRGLQGLVVRENALFAAAKGLKIENDEHGAIFRIPIQPDGTAGLIARLTQSDIKKPMGLVLDALGALYVSAEEIELTSKAKSAIGKVAFDGTVTPFASELKKPRGIAFDSFGNLYVADGKGDEHGRILRFRAPPPPTLIAPSFTNQSPLTVNGTAEVNSRIDYFLNNVSLPFTIAGEAGSFFLTLNLAPNAENSLTVFTTAHLGQGLTSGPADFTIIHDNTPPRITNLQPFSGSYLNTNRPLVRADFSDNLSGVDISRVQIQLDGNSVTSQVQVSGSGFALDPLTPSTLKLFPLSEGLRNVSVTIFDRAGNSASASTAFTVDVTPPDTQITGGPEGTISATSALFTFTGTDNLTPSGNLQFSWRLDGGPFSPFSPQTQASFTGLSPGPHTFEVKARDLAGNEDPTPAQRTFTVSVLTVKITDPADGATVSAGSLLVRGTVEAGGQEAGVAVNGFPAAVQGTTFAALIPVTPETTTLTAVATSAAGATASHSINISVVAAPAPAFTLLASPGSGVAPLTVSFSLLGGTAISSVQLDFDGNGTVDFTGTSLEGQTFTYIQPGIYVPVGRVIDTQGNQFTANAVVQVFDRSALDIMLQAKWSGMKDALRQGNITQALTHIVSGARARYEALFRVLAARLPNIDTILTAVTLDEVAEDEAFYEMVRIDAGITKSFEIRFGIDEDGIWRLRMF